MRGRYASDPSGRTAQIHTDDKLQHLGIQCSLQAGHHVLRCSLLFHFIFFSFGAAYSEDRDAPSAVPWRGGDGGGYSQSNDQHRLACGAMRGGGRVQGLGWHDEHRLTCAAHAGVHEEAAGGCSRAGACFHACDGNPSSFSPPGLLFPFPPLPLPSSCRPSTDARRRHGRHVLPATAVLGGGDRRGRGAGRLAVRLRHRGALRLLQDVASAREHARPRALKRAARGLAGGGGCRWSGGCCGSGGVGWG